MEAANLNFTHHARKRASQRNFSTAAIRLVQRYGTPAAEGLLMTRQNVAEAVAERRLELRLLATHRSNHHRHPGANRHD